MKSYSVFEQFMNSAFNYTDGDYSV